jgi:hypothetical protein
VAGILPATARLTKPEMDDRDNRRKRFNLARSTCGSKKEANP